MEWQRPQQAPHRIALLKMDVEMAEEDACAGISAQDWARTDCFAVEVHDVGGRLTRLRALLASHGLSEQSVTQEWMFTGTSIHSLVAARPAAPADDSAAGPPAD